jgi:hypothetical protein
VEVAVTWYKNELVAEPAEASIRSRISAVTAAVGSELIPELERRRRMMRGGEDRKMKG